MREIIADLNDNRLLKLTGSIKNAWSDRLVTPYFKRISAKYPEYDSNFLWLLMYQSDNNQETCRYLDENYRLYKKKLNILDSGFVKKLVANGNFQARVWEMIVCDMAASIGQLIAKVDAGPDILAKVGEQEVLIEVVAPNEALDENYRTIKPVYNSNGFFSHSGTVDVLELPVVLRFLKGFDEKAKDHAAIQSPFIIAINTGKVVNMTSYDEYVLRLSLFGLGCETITLNKDESTSRGLESKPYIEKGTKPIPSARFWSEDYAHVSGVIYSSQPPIGLTPNSYGWSNSGVYYIPNPMARQPISFDANFMHKMIVTESEYYQVEAAEKWQSTIKYDR